MLQREKEKLVRLVNKREKKKLVVRGMATLVPLPHLVVFAELVGWYGTSTRLCCCCCRCMQSAERVDGTAVDNVIHSLTAVENGPVAKSGLNTDIKYSNI
jgi:hypothetical protein